MLEFADPAALLAKVRGEVTTCPTLPRSLRRLVSARRVEVERSPVPNAWIANGRPITVSSGLLSLVRVLSMSFGVFEPAFRAHMAAVLRERGKQQLPPVDVLRMLQQDATDYVAGPDFPPSLRGLPTIAESLRAGRRSPREVDALVEDLAVRATDPLAALGYEAAGQSFVVGHELGHLLLGHTSELHGRIGRDAQRWVTQHTFHMEADQAGATEINADFAALALNTDPTDGYRSLLHAGAGSMISLFALAAGEDDSRLSVEHATHPSVETRIHLLFQGLAELSAVHTSGETGQDERLGRSWTMAATGSAMQFAAFGFALSSLLELD